MRLHSVYVLTCECGRKHESKDVEFTCACGRVNVIRWRGEVNGCGAAAAQPKTVTEKYEEGGKA